MRKHIFPSNAIIDNTTVPTLAQTDRRTMRTSHVFFLVNIEPVVNRLLTLCGA